MEQAKRAKVLNCEYKKEKSLIVWTLLVEGEKPVTMAFRPSDLVDAVGLKGTVTNDAIETFCREITNKEINWIDRVDFKDHPKPADMSNDDMWEMGRKLQEYPFKEVKEL